MRHEKGEWNCSQEGETDWYFNNWANKTKTVCTAEGLNKEIKIDKCNKSYYCLFAVTSLHFFVYGILLCDFSDFSSGRHADAIFTNSYRKVLGQISARKFLQTIMGKRLGYSRWHKTNDITSTCKPKKSEALHVFWWLTELNNEAWIPFFFV